MHKSYKSSFYMDNILTGLGQREKMFTPFYLQKQCSPICLTVYGGYKNPVSV